MKNYVIYGEPLNKNITLRMDKTVFCKVDGQKMIMEKSSSVVDGVTYRRLKRTIEENNGSFHNGRYTDLGFAPMRMCLGNIDNDGEETIYDFTII